MKNSTEEIKLAADNQKKFSIENERLYTINEAAKICGVSRSTILRMEENGYDKARYIDPNNGYHYYDVVNIHKIMMYQMLQKLGLSVAEICAYYRHELDPKTFLNDLYTRLDIARRCVDEFEARFSERESLEYSYFDLPTVTCYCFESVVSQPKSQIEYNYKKIQDIYEQGYKPFPTTPMFSITPDENSVFDEKYYTYEKPLICVAIYPEDSNGKLGEIIHSDKKAKSGKADTSGDDSAGVARENNDRIIQFKSKRAFSLLYHGNETDIMNTGGSLLLDEMRKRDIEPAGPLYGICVVGPFFGTDIEPDDYVFRWAIPVNEDK